MRASEIIYIKPLFGATGDTLMFQDTLSRPS